MDSFDQFSGGLAAGTLVTTPDGDKKIEEIKAGDWVLSGIGCDKTRFYPVSVAKAKTYRGPIFNVLINSSQNIRVTPNHICFASSINDTAKEDSVIIDAFNLLDPDNLQDSHFAFNPVHWVDFERTLLGDSHDLDDVERIALQTSKSNGGAEIERFAQFGESQAFWFMPATDLRVTTQVPVTKNGIVESATITKITEEQYDGLAYDLDIPEARNFAANGVLVHDSRA